MVYYRKYRSQTIAELDSPKLRETLYSVLSSKNIPHAFLFTGPKGLGKTSTARIIAKVLNCLHVDQNQASSSSSKQRESRSLAKESSRQARTISDIEPCNHCSQCVSITNGSNMDVLEIDGASNRGIDEIRDLRDKVKLAPSSAKKKVYIIDEVHMLTTEAFNALLKTIEEPPAHVVFIFCTTEPQKVPATIVSRCFHIALSKATDDEIVHALKRIVHGEKLDIDEEALMTIAKMSDGGYRDATKLLEELVAVSNGIKITKEFVEEKLHVSSILYFVSGILENLSKRDAKATLDVVEEVVKQGTDIKYFIAEILATLHALLLAEVGVSVSNTKYQIPNTKYSPKDIQFLVELLQESYLQTKTAVIPSLPLELAIVAWCNYENQGGMMGVGDPHKQTLGSLLKKEKNLKVQAVLKGTNGQSKLQPEADRSLDENGQSTHSQGDLSKSVNDVASLMENLIYKVKPYNHSVAGVLRGCTIASLQDGKIIFETAYTFHKEKLEETKTREVLEKAVREVTGKSLRVMVELKNK